MISMLSLFECITFSLSSIQYAGVEKCCPLGHILVWRYWKFIKIVNYIKSFCIIFYAKFFRIFLNILTKKVRQENSHNVNTSILYTTNAHFYNPSGKIGSTSFVSSSDTQKFHYLLGYHTTGINSSLHSFLSALHFSRLI